MLRLKNTVAAKFTIIACFLFSTGFLGGCQSLTSSQTLYDELGGSDGIQRIMNEFLNALSFDETLFKHFDGANVERFHEKFSEQLCQVSDGPCKYTGDSMVDVHTGMNITEAEFNHTVDLLVLAMNRAGVAHTTQNKLLARLAPMRSEVIKR